MKTSRVAGIPPVTDEQIVRYVRRFGPVTTGQIKRVLGSKSKNFAKQVGQCEGIEQCGADSTNSNEKSWRYRDVVSDP